MSLIAVISPAKRLNFDRPVLKFPLSQPQFAARARALIRIARQWTPEQIAHSMNLSPALAALNYERYQNFKLRGNGGTRQAALYAFAGDVYVGLDAASLGEEQVLVANERLRILSGLYGVLRPLDQIQPYRLEMGVRMETDHGNNLYAYWGQSLAKALNQSGAHNLVNLSSQEYWGAVDLRALKRPVITCHFKEWRGETLKIISFKAKKARGLMARYIIENDPQSAEDLKSFDAEGYKFSPMHSDAANLTFVKED